MVSNILLLATLVLHTSLGQDTSDRNYKFCFYLENIPRKDSKPKAEVYIKMTCGGKSFETESIPTTKVNSDIGGIYEYYKHYYGDNPMFDMEIRFAGSKEYIGRTKLWGPSHFKLLHTPFQLDLYNPEGEDHNKWYIKVDGKQSYLVVHFVTDNHVENSTYGRLKEANQKTILLRGKSKYG